MVSLLAIMGRILTWVCIPAGLLLTGPLTFTLGALYFSSPVRGLGGMFIPVLVLSGLVVAATGASPFALGIYRLKPRQRKPVLTLIILSTATIGGANYFLWSYRNIDDVVSSAEKIADNQPYCIYVPTNNGGREAGSPADFSAYLRLSTLETGYAGPRPVLAVGAGLKPRVYHWSFYRKSFIQDSGLSPVYCSARKHFALAMHGEPAAKTPVVRFRYADMSFSVPSIYRSEISYSSTPGIDFYATTPLFGRAPGPRQPGWFKSRIEVDFAETDISNFWLAKDGPDQIVEDRGEKYGLRMQAVWAVDSRRRVESRMTGLQYLAVTPDKKVITLINCVPGDVQGYCRDAFHSGGWTYTFSYRRDELPNWKSMQNKLVLLTRSFVETSTEEPGIKDKP